MDIFKDLYQKFLMRDLLGFIVPGTIIVLSFMYLLGLNVYQLLLYNGHISSLVYIPIFGLLYVVGFGIQCFAAELIPLIQYHARRCDKHKDKVCFWQKTCKDCFKVHLDKLVVVLKLPDQSQEQHERFVVLKQMCANNGLALSFFTIMMIVKNFLIFKAKSKIEPDYPVIFVWIVLVILVISLFKGYKSHLKKQEIWEDMETNKR